MICTEEEANKKWCPHAVASHTDPRRGFRRNQDGVAEEFPCLGSKCMAWRWFDIINDGEELVLVHKRYSQGGYSGKIEPDLSKRRGFCGLAGSGQ